MKNVTILAVAALATTTNANFVLNGDFETPAGGGQSAHLGTLANWTALADVVEIANGSAIGVSGHGGAQVLDLGGTFPITSGPKADVYQDIFLPIGTGTFSFKWGQRLVEPVNANRLTFSLISTTDTLATGSLAVFPVGQPLDTYTTPITVTTAGTYRLRFTEDGYLTPGAGMVVDDVVVDVVPEPATLLAMAAGTACAFLRRRRN
jgi:hypothetical protein